MAEVGESPFHCCRICEIGAHAPPDPGQTARQIELLSQLHDDFCVAVSFEERRRERDPLPGCNRADKVEQENEQVVCLSRGRGE